MKTNDNQSQLANNIAAALLPDSINSVIAGGSLNATQLNSLRANLFGSPESQAILAKLAVTEVRACPPKPWACELYQHGYGAEKPVSLGEWQWNCTFNRWSRLVTFADGWEGFSYPVETI